MDNAIAELTRTMINDLKYNEVDITRDEMKSWLDHQYCMKLQGVELSENPEISMIKLLAIKQMIDALNYNPN